MRLLVGFDREEGPEILQTAKAYDVAYNYLLRIMIGNGFCWRKAVVTGE